jgi:hypothetical protein
VKNRERNNIKCISYLPKCYSPNATSRNNKGKSCIYVQVRCLEPAPKPSPPPALPLVLALSRPISSHRNRPSHQSFLSRRLFNGPKLRGSIVSSTQHHRDTASTGCDLLVSVFVPLPLLPPLLPPPLLPPPPPRGGANSSTGGCQGLVPAAANRRLAAEVSPGPGYIVIVISNNKFFRLNSSELSEY